MKERDWRTLIHNIGNGNCILVLGPDVAKVKANGALKPLAEILANDFAAEVERERKVLDRNDLALTAQLYAEISSESDLQLDTADFYQKDQPTETPVYEALASLPFRFIVNATPDRELIKAKEKLGLPYLVDWYNFRGKKVDMAKWSDKNKPLIYYLYGCTDVPESLVISEKQLLEFLVSVISKDPPIHSNILSEFSNNERCFLFLGFGFRNWYLRILLYVLLGLKGRKNERTSRSFALEEIVPGNGSETFEHICFLFGKDLNVDFSDMPVENFVKELKDRFAVYVGSNGEATTQDASAIEAPDDAPSVFISYASEDKDRAMALRDKLKNGGLNPWFDKDGLRGGDDWERMLEKTIKDVDYFVVLQSNALAARETSVVFKEVRHALQRQQEFRFGISFIMPVKIDECELMDELANLHTLDLIDLEQADLLIKDIRRDQQRRKK